MNDNIIKLTNAFTERLKENTIVKDKLKEENANLNRENDRLNDELENLKEAYGGENAKLKEENNKLQMDSGFHKSFSFYNQEEVHKLKEELSEAKAEALILDKAYDLVCDYTGNDKHHDFELFYKIAGGLVLGTISFKKALKEHYLKEARKC